MTINLTVINIDKTQNFTINGNNHVIEGINKPNIFNYLWWKK